MLEIDRLNEMLTELEGEKMDQADTIHSLETRLETFMDDGTDHQYVETIKAKDQIIANLEKKILENDAEFTKQVGHFKICFILINFRKCIPVYMYCHLHGINDKIPVSFYSATPFKLAPDMRRDHRAIGSLFSLLFVYSYQALLLFCGRDTYRRSRYSSKEWQFCNSY